VVVASTLLTSILGVTTQLAPLAQGLKAEYFSDESGASPAVASTLDSQPSTGHLVDAWQGSPPEVFSATWTGSIVALREGTYTLATVSDDGSSVFVDGRLVVDNGGRHGARLATGFIHLARGTHAVWIHYFQAGGAFHFEFLWARDGSRLEPVPAWALRPRAVRSYPRVLAAVLRDFSLAFSEWVWVGLLVLWCASAVGPQIARLRAFLERQGAWPSLGWILAGSLILNLAGIGWGLPGEWAGIELKPEYVLDGMSQHFSHGWFDFYPPFQYYVLTVAMSPVLLLSYLGRMSVDGAGVHTFIVVIFRLISVAAAAGTLIATFLCGTHAFGRRAGLFAAGIVGLTTPFLYYAKTANVDLPYLFWFALSLMFYVRLLDISRTEDYVLFAATATLAVCTKDQAYGLYLLAPPVIIQQMWRANRQAGRSHPLWRAVFDRRLATAAITAAVLFAACHNLLFNLTGFLKHVRLITGSGSVPYRMFEPTPAGRLELLRLTVHIIEVSLGWPLFLVSVSGLLVAAATPHLRRTATWLVLPVVSYYLGFIEVILYNYDRFVLPICLVLALFGGLALDVFVAESSRAARRATPSAFVLLGRPWRVAGVILVFAYTLLYAGTVDVLMLEDSRYAVEAWASTRVGREDLVGVTGLQEQRARLDNFSVVDVGDVAGLERERPLYFVLNADYALAVPPESSWGQLIGGLQHGSLGYRLVGRFRRESPWSWLPGAHPDLVGSRRETPVFSTLRNINPTIEVFRRDAPRASPPEAADLDRQRRDPAHP
jgi:hypothetical protein